MANTKLTALTAEAAPTVDDITYLVNDPAGTPVSRKASLDAIRTLFRGYVSKNANYTAVSADRFIAADATGGAFTITLTACASLPVGHTLTIKKTDSSNFVLIDANASELIDGDTTQILFSQNSFVTLVNTGTAWLIAAQNGLTSDAVFLATATGTVANTTTETTVIGSGIGTLTLPANFFRVGKSIRVKAMGIISNTGTPTLNTRFKLGSTTICASGAITTASGLANHLYMIDVLLTCRTVGGSGTVFAQGALQLGTAISGMPATAAITVDTTTALVVDLTAQWGAASASNTLSVSNVEVSRLN